MKHYLLLVIAALTLVFSSCKKDLDFEPEMSLPEQPFFVEGEYYDTEDSAVRTFAWDMRREEGEIGDLPGTAYTTGANENNKYAVSAIAYDPHVFLLTTPIHYNRDPFLSYTQPFIGVRFVSDLPKEEYGQEFTAAELEDLLQVGSYSFGTESGQAEIIIIGPNGGSTMLSPIPVWEDSYNQLEVLAVEDYEYPATGSQEEPTRGKLVHLRGQAAIKYPLVGVERTHYFRLEGKFLFTYE